MEDVLDLYQMPYDPKRPLWCMDEKPYQLLGETREPLPMRPGDVTKIDSEYKRNGTASIFCFIQPHSGRIFHFVEETRTALDWAEKVRYLADNVEPDAEKIVQHLSDVKEQMLLSGEMADFTNYHFRIRSLDAIVIQERPHHIWLGICNRAALARGRGG